MTTKQGKQTVTKMPQSPEAEVALLGSIFFEPEVMNLVFDEVKPGDFYIPANRAVAQVLWRFWDERKPIDIAVVYNELCKRKQDTVVGGHEGLMRIADAMPEPTHAKHYARIVAEKSQLRRLALAAKEIEKLVFNDSEEPSEMLSKAESLMSKALLSRTIKSAVKVSEQAEIEIASLTSEDKTGFGLPTGFTDLDDTITGLHPGEMTIVAARPSMGKTSFVLNVMRNFALEQKRTVLMFSPETRASQITRNLLGMETRVSVHKMRKLALKKEDKTKLALSIFTFQDCDIYIDDETETIGRVRSVARHLHLKHPLSLVVLDYMQLLCQEIKYKRQELEVISRDMKRLAVELNVPTLVVSQLSRAVEYRGRHTSQKRATTYFRAGETVYTPKLSDLRESGAIEQDADNVLLLYRQDYYRTGSQVHDQLAHLHIAKQRHGPTGRIVLTFLKEYLRFENYVREDSAGAGREPGEEQGEFDEEQYGDTVPF